MSPERLLSRTSIATKPYFRDTFAPSPSAKKHRLIGLLQDPPTPRKKDTTEQLGFPTLAQYHTIEKGYIDSLTPRRKGKALISQALFDRIWHVLHNDNAPNETAQFRFWVRKMFTISKTYTLCGEHRPIGREVLLHDGLLVAVREQIYELLCYYHGVANHGGRDKTCAGLRKHYTWVPKDLVAQFVKACPTCILRRCGRAGDGILSAQPRVIPNSPALPSVAGKLDVKKEESSPVLPPLKGFSDGTDCPKALLDLLPGTSITPLPRLALPLGPISVNQINLHNQSTSNALSTPADFSLTGGIPLSKEPQGGWEYWSANHKNLSNEYLDTQPLAPTMSYGPALGHTHPDIPDVSLMFKPGFKDAINFKVEDSPYFFDGQPSAPTMSPPGITVPSPSLATSSTVGSESPDMPFDLFMPEFPLAMEFPSSGGVSPISRKDVLLSGVQANVKNVRMASAPTVPSYVTPGSHNTNTAGTSVPSKLKAWDSVQAFRDLFMNGEDLNLDSLVSGYTAASAQDNGQSGNGGDIVYGNNSGNSSPESGARSDVSEMSFGAAGTSGSGSPASINTPVTPVYDKTGAVDMFGLSTGDLGRGVGLGTVLHNIYFGDFEI